MGHRGTAIGGKAEGEKKRSAVSGRSHNKGVPKNLRGSSFPGQWPKARRKQADETILGAWYRELKREGSAIVRKNPSELQWKNLYEKMVGKKSFLKKGVARAAAQAWEEGTLVIEVSRTRP